MFGEAELGLTDIKTHPTPIAAAPMVLTSADGGNDTSRPAMPAGAGLCARSVEVVVVAVVPDTVHTAGPSSALRCGAKRETPAAAEPERNSWHTALLAAAKGFLFATASDADVAPTR